MKYFIFGLVLFLFGCSKLTEPKYKVGDCTEFPVSVESKDCEFKCAPSSDATKVVFNQRILQIGKTHYLTLNKWGISETKISVEDSVTTLVACPDWLK